MEAVKVKAKKPTKKPAKKPSKKPVKAKKVKKGKILSEKKLPTTGQSAPPRDDLAFEVLNPKERKVFIFLNGTGKGKRAVKALTEMASACFGNKKKAQANSWIRNSLRRLVVGGWVEKVERGAYRVTEKGRKRYKNVVKL